MKEVCLNNIDLDHNVFNLENVVNLNDLDYKNWCNVVGKILAEKLLNILPTIINDKICIVMSVDDVDYIGYSFITELYRNYVPETNQF